MAEPKASFLKNNWKRYLFELLVIIVGITISFALQNWHESRHKRTMEIQTLERLLVDLKADTSQMVREIESMQESINGGQRITEISDFIPHADSLDIFISSQLRYTVFTKSDIAYQGLRSFGKNGLISNQKLLNDIIHQYSVNYRILDEWNHFDRSFLTSQLLPFITSRFPTFGGGNDTEEVLFKKINKVMLASEFQNLCTINVSNKTQIATSYQENIDAVVELIGNIEAELKALN